MATNLLDLTLGQVLDLMADKVAEQITEDVKEYNETVLHHPDDTKYTEKAWFQTILDGEDGIMRMSVVTQLVDRIKVRLDR